MAGGFWLGGLGITSVLSADLLALSGSDLSLKLEGLQPSVKQLGRKVRGHKMVCGRSSSISGSGSQVGGERSRSQRGSERCTHLYGEES